MARSNEIAETSLVSLEFPLLISEFYEWNHSEAPTERPFKLLSRKPLWRELSHDFSLSFLLLTSDVIKRAAYRKGNGKWWKACHLDSSSNQGLPDYMLGNKIVCKRTYFLSSLVKVANAPIPILSKIKAQRAVWLARPSGQIWVKFLHPRIYFSKVSVLPFFGRSRLSVVAYKKHVYVHFRHELGRMCDMWQI